MLNSCHCCQRPCLGKKVREPVHFFRTAAILSHCHWQVFSKSPPPFLTLNSPFIVLPDAVSGERRDRDQVRPKFGQIFPSAFIRSCLNTHIVPPTYIRLPNSWQTSWRPSQHMYIHACVYTCLHILPVHPFRTGNTMAALRRSLLLCLLHTLA